MWNASWRVNEQPPTAAKEKYMWQVARFVMKDRLKVPDRLIEGYELKMKEAAEKGDKMLDFLQPDHPHYSFFLAMLKTEGKDLSKDRTHRSLDEDDAEDLKKIRQQEEAEKKSMEYKHLKEAKFKEKATTAKRGDFTHRWQRNSPSPSATRKRKRSSTPSTKKVTLMVAKPKFKPKAKKQTKSSGSKDDPSEDKKTVTLLPCMKQVKLVVRQMVEKTQEKAPVRPTGSVAVKCPTVAKHAVTVLQSTSIP